jgi:hypothetical protein
LNGGAAVAWAPDSLVVSERRPDGTLAPALGTWTFTVDDVVLDGYELNRGNGALSASIEVK